MAAKKSVSAVGGLMVIGAGAGAALGATMDKIGVGLAIGLALGLIFGFGIDANRRKNGDGGE